MCTQKRWLLAAILLLVGLGATACYKDAGENVEPTRPNRVDLNDISTSTSTPVPPTLTASPSADGDLGALSTDANPPTGTPTEPSADLPDTPASALATKTLVPTPTKPGATSTIAVVPIDASPQVQPSFTPKPADLTATSPGIVTPSRSDLLPSPTPIPSPPPASDLEPTPTTMIQEDPCVYVVQGGDTLFSIAEDNEVELDDLRAANSSLIGFSDLIQPGWELQLPGCVSSTSTPAATEAPPIDLATAQPVTASPVPVDGKVRHTVKAGETVFGIAQQYPGVSPEDIIAANNLPMYGDTPIIQVGQELVIPPPVRE
jgi:LysM repeat protein